MKRIAAIGMVIVVVTMLLTGCTANKLEQIIVPETVELAVNSTHALPIEMLPMGIAEPNLTWTSDNEAVVIVDGEGMLTAHSPGNATITVMADGGVSALTTVTVFVPVEGVGTPEALTLAVGETADLGVEYFPDDATDVELEFISADVDIAAVDANGCVTAHAKGETLIAVTAGGKSAMTRITVRQPVCEVVLDKTEALLTVGFSFTLSASLLPADVDEGLACTWSSDDPTVATVDAYGTVSAVAPGNTVVTLTTENGCQAACHVEVKAPMPVSSEIPAAEGEASPTVPGTSPSEGDVPGDDAGSGEGAGCNLGATMAVGAEHAQSLGFVVHTSPGGYSYPAPYVPLGGATQAQADAAVISMVTHAYNMVTRGGELPFYEGTEIFIYEAGGFIFVAY